MITAIQEAADAIVKAATEQSQRLMSELSAMLDAKDAAQVQFNDAMANVAAKRTEADRAQADAIRFYDAAMTNLSSIIVSLQNQVGNGQIITGTVVPSTRKPRLVKAAE